MYKIGILNSISITGLRVLTDKYKTSDRIAGSTGLILRSKDIHNVDFPKELMAIARAGAGVNNIPLEKAADQGIVVFNTPGANSNAVKELVIGSLLMYSRNLLPALQWCKTLEGNPLPQVEEGKGKFKGREIAGKTIGIIGLGAVGRKVANSCKSLDMNVVGYDPYLSLENALALDSSVTVTDNIKELLNQSDFVTVHMPVLQSTTKIIDSKVFSQMKPEAVLLNFSRDKLIDEGDLLYALDKHMISAYITDFATEKLLNHPLITAIPHLGASTVEAEEKCSQMAAESLMDYIENGNITNSVNFPDVSLGPIKNTNRIAVLTKWEPYPVKLAMAMFADKNITAAKGGVKGDYGYALLNTTDEITAVPKVPGVIKVRVFEDL